MLGGCHFCGNPCARSLADVFGGGANSFAIEFVTIGNPGNPPDTTGNPNPAGSVPYVYRMGKYEISEQMIEKANALGGLGITLADMTPYGGNGPNKPATGVTWFEASTGSTRAQVTRLPTSSTAAAIFNCGRPAIPGTTRAISFAMAWRNTFCQARRSGTRRRSLIQHRARIGITQQRVTQRRWLSLVELCPVPL